MSHNFNQTNSLNQNISKTSPFSSYNSSTTISRQPKSISLTPILQIRRLIEARKDSILICGTGIYAETLLFQLLSHLNTYPPTLLLLPQQHFHDREFRQRLNSHFRSHHLPLAKPLDKTILTTTVSTSTISTTTNTTTNSIPKQYYIPNSSDPDKRTSPLLIGTPGGLVYDLLRGTIDPSFFNHVIFADGTLDDSQTELVRLIFRDKHFRGIITTFISFSSHPERMQREFALSHISRTFHINNILYFPHSETHPILTAHQFNLGLVNDNDDIDSPFYYYSTTPNDNNNKPIEIDLTGTTIVKREMSTPTTSATTTTTSTNSSTTNNLYSMKKSTSTTSSSLPLYPIKQYINDALYPYAFRSAPIPLYTYNAPMDFLPTQLATFVYRQYLHLYKESKYLAEKSKLVNLNRDWIKNDEIYQPYTKTFYNHYSAYHNPNPIRNVPAPEFLEPLTQYMKYLQTHDVANGAVEDPLPPPLSTEPCPLSLDFYLLYLRVLSQKEMSRDNNYFNIEIEKIFHYRRLIRLYWLSFDLSPQQLLKEIDNIIKSEQPESYHTNLDYVQLLNMIEHSIAVCSKPVKPQYQPISRSSTSRFSYLQWNSFQQQLYTGQTNNEFDSNQLQNEHHLHYHLLYQQPSNGLSTGNGINTTTSTKTTSTTQMNDIDDNNNNNDALPSITLTSLLPNEPLPLPSSEYTPPSGASYLVMNQRAPLRLLASIPVLEQLLKFRSFIPSICTNAIIPSQLTQSTQSNNNTKSIGLHQNGNTSSPDKKKNSTMKLPLLQQYNDFPYQIPSCDPLHQNNVFIYVSSSTKKSLRTVQELLTSTGSIQLTTRTIITDSWNPNSTSFTSQINNHSTTLNNNSSHNGIKHTIIISPRLSINPPQNFTMFHFPYKNALPTKSIPPKYLRNPFWSLFIPLPIYFSDWLNYLHQQTTDYRHYIEKMNLYREKVYRSFTDFIKSDEPYTLLPLMAQLDEKQINDNNDSNDPSNQTTTSTIIITNTSNNQQSQPILTPEIILQRFLVEYHPHISPNLLLKRSTNQSSKESSGGSLMKNKGNNNNNITSVSNNSNNTNPINLQHFPLYTQFLREIGLSPSPQSNLITLFDFVYMNANAIRNSAQNNTQSTTTTTSTTTQQPKPKASLYQRNKPKDSTTTSTTTTSSTDSTPSIPKIDKLSLLQLLTTRTDIANILRTHGQTYSNIDSYIDCSPSAKYHLYQKDQIIDSSQPNAILQLPTTLVDATRPGSTFNDPLYILLRKTLLFELWSFYKHLDQTRPILHPNPDKSTFLPIHNSHHAFSQSTLTIHSLPVRYAHIPPGLSNSIFAYFEQPTKHFSQPFLQPMNSDLKIPFNNSNSTTTTTNTTSTTSTTISLTNSNSSTSNIDMTTESISLSTLSTQLSSFLTNLPTTLSPLMQSTSKFPSFDINNNTIHNHSLPTPSSFHSHLSTLLSLFSTKDNNNTTSTTPTTPNLSIMDNDSSSSLPLLQSTTLPIELQQVASKQLQLTLQTLPPFPDLLFTIPHFITASMYQPSYDIGISLMKDQLQTLQTVQSKMKDNNNNNSNINNDDNDDLFGGIQSMSQLHQLSSELTQIRQTTILNQLQPTSTTLQHQMSKQSKSSSQQSKPFESPVFKSSQQYMTNLHNQNSTSQQPTFFTQSIDDVLYHDAQTDDLFALFLQPDLTSQTPPQQQSKQSSTNTIDTKSYNVQSIHLNNPFQIKINDYPTTPINHKMNSKSASLSCETIPNITHSDLRQFLQPTVVSTTTSSQQQLKSAASTNQNNNSTSLQSRRLQLQPTINISPSLFTDVELATIQSLCSALSTTIQSTTKNLQSSSFTAPINSTPTTTPPSPTVTTPNLSYLHTSQSQQLSQQHSQQSLNDDKNEQQPAFDDFQIPNSQLIHPLQWLLFFKSPGILTDVTSSFFHQLLFTTSSRCLSTDLTSRGEYISSLCPYPYSYKPKPKPSTSLQSTSLIFQMLNPRIEPFMTSNSPVYTSTPIMIPKNAKKKDVLIKPETVDLTKLFHNFKFQSTPINNPTPSVNKSILLQSKSQQQQKPMFTSHVMRVQSPLVAIQSPSLLRPITQSTFQQQQLQPHIPLPLTYSSLSPNQGMPHLQLLYLQGYVDQMKLLISITTKLWIVLQSGLKCLINNHNNNNQQVESTNHLNYTTLNFILLLIFILSQPYSTFPTPLYPNQYQLFNTYATSHGLFTPIPIMKDKSSSLSAAHSTSLLSSQTTTNPSQLSTAPFQSNQSHQPNILSKFQYNQFNSTIITSPLQFTLLSIQNPIHSPLGQTAFLPTLFLRYYVLSSSKHFLYHLDHQLWTSISDIANSTLFQRIYQRICLSLGAKLDLTGRYIFSSPYINYIFNQSQYNTNITSSTTIASHFTQLQNSIISMIDAQMGIFYPTIDRNGFFHLAEQRENEVFLNLKNGLQPLITENVDDVRRQFEQNNALLEQKRIELQENGLSEEQIKTQLLKYQMTTTHMDGVSREELIAAHHDDGSDLYIKQDLLSSLQKRLHLFNVPPHLQIVWIDSRELRSTLILKLYQTKLSLQVRTFYTGDYVLLNGIIGIERKAPSDYIQSLNKGRLYQQLTKMLRTFQRSILLIEFNDNNLNDLLRLQKLGSTSFKGSSNKNCHPNNELTNASADLRSTNPLILRTIMMYYTFPNIHYLWANNPDTTCKIFKLLQHKYQHEAPDRLLNEIERDADDIDDDDDDGNNSDNDIDDESTVSTPIDTITTPTPPTTTTRTKSKPITKPQLTMGDVDDDNNNNNNLHDFNSTQNDFSNHDFFQDEDENDNNNIINTNNNIDPFEVVQLSTTNTTITTDLTLNISQDSNTIDLTSTTLNSEQNGMKRKSIFHSASDTKLSNSKTPPSSSLTSNTNGKSTKVQKTSKRASKSTTTTTTTISTTSLPQLITKSEELSICDNVYQILLAMPGVSERNVRTILTQFNSLQELSQSSQEVLKTRLGPILGVTLYRFFHSK